MNTFYIAIPIVERQLQRGSPAVTNKVSGTKRMIVANWNLFRVLEAKCNASGAIYAHIRKFAQNLDVDVLHTIQIQYTHNAANGWEFFGGADGGANGWIAYPVRWIWHARANIPRCKCITVIRWCSACESCERYLSRSIFALQASLMPSQFMNMWWPTMVSILTNTHTLLHSGEYCRVSTHVAWDINAQIHNPHICAQLTMVEFPWNVERYVSFVWALNSYMHYF